MSPYHLCTREPPVMLAAALGSSVTTLMPEPPSGPTRSSVGSAVDQAPRYLRLLQSWRWSGPLWEAGVMRRGMDGAAAGSMLDDLYKELREQERWAPLRAVAEGMRRFESGTLAALDALAGDMLRGGPDPGFNIPVTATLDRFAAGHNLLVVRGVTASLAQRAELQLGTRFISFGIPTLIRAGGGRLLDMRDDLARQLDRLRVSLAELCAEALEHADLGVRDSRSRGVAQAAKEFAEAFDAWRVRGGSGDDENGERITTGYVGVQSVLLPEDAALRSGIAAIRSVGVSAPISPPDPGASRIVALFVRELNARPIG